MLGDTSTTIVNRAINLIGGDQKPVTGQWPNFDDSAAGQAANILYQGAVQTAGRKHGFDFSRNQVTLALTANAAPMGYLFEYLYPTNGIQVRQLIPTADAGTDPNDPLPVNWTVGNATVAAAPTKVIWTDLDDALALITNQPPEALWDALFTEEVVRLLASELAQAIEGKPDTAQANLETSAAFGSAGESRDS